MEREPFAILFFDPDGKLTTVTLGTDTKEEEEAVKKSLYSPETRERLEKIFGGQEAK